MEIRGPKNDASWEWDDWVDADEPEEGEPFVLVAPPPAPSNENNNDAEDSSDGFVVTNETESENLGATSDPQGEENKTKEDTSHQNDKDGDTVDLIDRRPQFFGALSIILLLLISEVFHVFVYLPPKASIESKSVDELDASLFRYVIVSETPAQTPTPAWSVDCEDFESLKNLAAPPPDVKPTSFRINEVVPIPSPRTSSSNEQGMPLMLPARASPLLLGSNQVEHQNLGDILTHRPVVVASSSGPIPSKGYILAEYDEHVSKAFPVQQQEPQQIPARALIPFAPPRASNQQDISREVPMPKRRVVEGPIYNETVSSNSTSSSSAVLFEANGSTVFIGQHHRVQSTTDYVTFIKENKQIFMVFSNAPTVVDPLWTELAVRVHQEKPSVRVASVDCTALAGLCRDLRISDFPTTFFVGNHGRETIRIKNENISLDRLMEYLEPAAGGRNLIIQPENRIKPSTPLKIEKSRENDNYMSKERKLRDQRNDASVSLTPSTFVEFVQKQDRVFVAFYHPSDPEEEQFTPLWDDFALHVVDQGLPLRAATVDCGLYSSFCKEQRIRHFPILRWYDHGERVTADNADKGTFKHLIMFAKSMLRQTGEKAARMNADAVVEATHRVDQSQVAFKKARRSRKAHPTVQPLRQTQEDKSSTE